MPFLHQFTFVEEIVLLALDDQTGALQPMPALAFDYVLAGAILCDLAMRGRIDTDPEQLVVLDPQPTHDALLDGPLQTIAAAPRPEPVARWLAVFATDARRIEAAALDRLVSRGVLRREEKKVLWVFGVRRYPTIDNHERTEVRTRLAALIRGDELPDPGDAILLSLLTASHLAQRIFTGPEFEGRGQRLATLARMDLVGREVAAAVNSVAEAMSRALPIGM